MNKKKSIILFLTILCLTKQIQAINWQVRNYHLISFNIRKDIKFNTEQTFRIKQNPSKPYYVDTTQSILFSYHKNCSVGLGMRNFFHIKPQYPKKWLHVIELLFLLNQKTKILGTNVYTEFEASQRSLEKEGNWGCGAFRIKLDLLKFKNSTLYLMNKFFYNYHDTQRYDRNRFFLGTNIKLLSNSNIEPFLLLESNKNITTLKWALTKIIGLRITANI